MVTFKRRPFDLSQYRAAVRTAQPDAAVRRCVAALERQARAHQAPFARAVAGLGGRVVQHWWLVNACAIEVPFARLDAIRAHPMVLRIHPDRAVRPFEFIKQATNARNHAADGLHARGIRGAGVAVAIIDSGVDSDLARTGRPHRAFYVDGDPTNRTGGGIGGSRVLENVQLGPLRADDLMNHGTGVAAIAAGEVWSTGPVADAGHAPRARIVSYSILHTIFGGSTLATITTAFQRAAADRTRHGIVAVNNSFSGSSDPTDPSQQAMDAAARDADLLVVVSAGNSGNRALNSPSAANGLAVGAVEADTHVVARFSAIGPLTTDRLRTYPDLVANGVNVVMPKIDTERPGDVYQASGTSFAAPQVCGAAALYRSVRSTASALETKAAILATTADVRAANPTVPGQERNHFGLGYLRDDKLIALAQGGGVIRNAAVTTSQPSYQVRVPVVAGREYAAVIAWYRHDLAATEWSDLDLVVEAGGDLLGAGRSPRNLYERVTFRAPVSGDVTLTVTGNHLEIARLQFALVCVETAGHRIDGGVVPFGAGCPGSGRVRGVARTAPAGLRNRFGDLAMDVLMYQDRRQQFVYDSAPLPAKFTVRSLHLRVDPVLVPQPGVHWTDLEIRMAHAPNGPANISGSFAGNIVGPTTTVFDRKRVQLPVVSGRNTDPTAWRLTLPLDSPFSFDRAGGRHLLVDFIHHGASTNSTGLLYPTNGVWERSGPPLVSWLLGQRGSRTGGRLTGRGPVLGFELATPGGVAPVLSAARPPRPWTIYTIDLRAARERSPATLITGLSDRTFGGLPLPFDLTPLGAPGCSLLVSGEVLLSGTTGMDGSLQFRLPVPWIPGTVGNRLFQQALVLDPVNPFGAAWTNGLRLAAGGR